MDIPKIPLGRSGEAGIHWITAHFSSAIEGFGTAVTALDGALAWVLAILPPPGWIAVFVALAWHAAGRGTAAFAMAGLLIVWDQGLWPATVQTLALVLTATLLSLVIAIPVGIAIAENQPLRAVVTPMLDFLQTMPRFVYLIPAVIILGIDVAPAVFATLTLATVPPIRIIAVGVAEVDPSLLEAGEAMGCSRWELLRKVKLPLAMPAIMLGVNQCLMMSLSMVIIASLIGAAGLGDEILRAIAQLDAGQGIMAGFAVFVLAIVLDRITRGWAERMPQVRRASAEA
jgi:ABC-type proline/glycine betaine transport system permease subunit